MIAQQETALWEGSHIKKVSHDNKHSSIELNKGLGAGRWNKRLSNEKVEENDHFTAIENTSLNLVLKLHSKSPPKFVGR